MLALLVTAALCADPITITGKVVYVVDGDTFDLLVDSKPIRVRLKSIDTPERKQPFGTVATRRLKELIHGRELSLEYTSTDRYGRPLVTPIVDGVNLNEMLVSEGLAWHAVKYSRSKRLTILEHDAREFRRGLWADPLPIPPWEWRRAKR
jgi:micrococcal nuclease